MDVRSKQSIQEHLQREDVQERILRNIHRGRDEATVTISQAAELFGITENKLRDWEEYGFLNPLRPGGPKGRRLYTPGELDKLAIIRELINAGYSASDIPPDIDKLWNAIRLLRTSGVSVPSAPAPSLLAASAQQIDLPITTRIAQARADFFWRYFVSHTLRFSLKLICEDIPNTTAGLLLPLSSGVDSSSIRRVDDLANVGESLVGWLSHSGTSQTLVTARPTFQYSSDFRIEPLRAVNEEHLPKGQQDNTIIILQREASPLALNTAVVTTIRRLLQPLYENTARSRNCMSLGMRDVLDPSIDLDVSTSYDDAILTGLADMIIHLGGIAANEQPRWRSCWILTPKDSTLPLHLSNLVIRAQNHDSSYKSKYSIPSPDKYTNTPYLKALRSRHIIYEPDMPLTNTDAATPLWSTDEPPIRSAIALPISGEEGIPIGVLYIASHYIDAFSREDQSVLRLMARMISELLHIYNIRQHTTQKITDVIKNPGLVDTFFEGLQSEYDFHHDLEALLSFIQRIPPEEISCEKYAGKTLSFISLDIDKQSSLANKYGDRLVRNLIREVGLRIQEQIRSFFKEYADCQLYHLYADRFLILLKNTTLEQTREHAEQLRIGACGPYKLDALRIFSDQQSRAESLIELNDITIRLGVTSYPYNKVAEILHEQLPNHAITAARTVITSALDVALTRGQIEGGNVVISWDYEIRNFIRWSPTRTNK